MKKNIFIAADGGGTKVHLAIEDEAGNLLGEGIGGASNICLSVETTWKSINNALEQALKQAKLNLADPHINFYAGFALAGCEVSSAIKKFKEYPHSFKKIILHSDAHAACLGAHHANDGMIVILGTGTVAYQIQGKTHHKIGGWGFPHGDEGGGAWLGLKAIRRTTQWLDKQIEATPLLKALFKKFNNDEGELVAWANQANSTEFAKLAPLIMEHLACDDPVALELIKISASIVNSMIKSLDKQAQNTETVLPVCLFGGIASFVQPYINPKFIDRLITRKFDATKGAMLMIKNSII